MFWGIFLFIPFFFSLSYYLLLFAPNVLTVTLMLFTAFNRIYFCSFNTQWKMKQNYLILSHHLSLSYQVVFDKQLLFVSLNITLFIQFLWFDKHTWCFRQILNCWKHVHTHKNSIWRKVNSLVFFFNNFDTSGSVWLFFVFVFLSYLLIIYYLILSTRLINNFFLFFWILLLYSFYWLLFGYFMHVMSHKH